MMLAMKVFSLPEYVSHRPFSVPAVHVVGVPVLSDIVSIHFIIT